MSKTDRVLQLAKRIVETEKELAFLRAELDRLLGDAPARSRSSTKPAGRASLQDLVRLALEDRSPARATADAIADAISAPIESVRAALSKLVTDGRVVRVGRGLYASSVLPAGDLALSSNGSSPP